MPRPSFFVVGAPKCGTTSLCHYLNQHLEIFIPQRKELNFFASDLELHRHFDSELEYVDAFRDGRGKICGEGTVWYLCSETAASEIRSFNDQAKIIISLRNPTEVACSLHNFFVYMGWEDIVSFDEALKRQEVNLDGGTGLHMHSNRVTRQIYTLAPMYHEQVKRYLNIFEPANVKIILFDDLISSTSIVYEEICSFLGVAPQACPVLTVHNPGKQWRNQRLQAWQRRPPASIRRMWHFLPLPVRSTISGCVRNLNTRVAAPPLDPDLRRRLNHEFRPDVERLSALLGRDLTHWVAE